MSHKDTFFAFYDVMPGRDTVLLGGEMQAALPDGPTDAEILRKAKSLITDEYMGDIKVERGQLYTCVVFEAWGPYPEYVAYVREVGGRKPYR